MIRQKDKEAVEAAVMELDKKGRAVPPAEFFGNLCTKYGKLLNGKTHPR